MTGKHNGDRSPRTRAARMAVAALAMLAGALAIGQGHAETAECARLRSAIASAHGDGQAAGAASRQRAELARTNAYANSIGCNNQKFLIFGSEPPAQCGEIKGQIAQLQASVAALEGRAGGGRAALVARFNAECSEAQAPQGPRNFLEALFGGGAKPQSEPYQPVDPQTLSPDQQQQTIEKSIAKEKRSANVSAGAEAVCVRTCDGSFFPVSYSGAGSRLEDVCRSLCPNADVQLYSFPFGGTIEQAVSLTGQRYVDMPNALKFQQTFDSTCSCRRKGESWAEALAAAEAKYVHEAHDILVTPEKSIELSRPIIAKASVDAKASADAKAKAAKTKSTPTPTPDAAAGADPGAGGAQPGGAQPAGQVLTDAGQRLNANGENAALSAAAATVSREASGIAGGGQSGGAFFGGTQGRTVTQTGPDGVQKKVRIVGPSL